MLGPENIVADALFRPSPISSSSTSALVSPSRVALVWDPGLTFFEGFLPGSVPSLLSLPPLDVPVIFPHLSPISVADHLPLCL